MKKPWIAAVLSLFCPGLGQLYVGRPRRAVAFLLLPLVVTLAVLGLVVLTPSGLVLALLLLLCLAWPIALIYAAIDAHRLARTAESSGDTPWWQDPLTYAIVLVVGAVYPLFSVLFLRSEVVEAFKIPTMSMAPTIVRGDRILVRKLGWGSEDVRRGDLVVFLAPEGSPCNIVKRVTALPGDRVQTGDGSRLVVPPDHLWVRGDNVENARDSRHFGAVPFANLVGLVTYRYWPPSRAGTLPTEVPAALATSDEARPSPAPDAARLQANETAAIATLRSLIAAQAHYQAIAKADQDGDGVGEYGGFLELSAAAPGRGGSVLAPPVLSAPFREVVEGGEVVRSGYVFQIFLPGPAAADGRAPGVPEPVPGGYPDDGGKTLDADLAETAWCCYAWPETYGASGLRTFFVNQMEDMFACDVPAYTGSGQGPGADAAFVDAGSITGAVDAGGPGKNPDGEAWKQVN